MSDLREPRPNELVVAIKAEGLSAGRVRVHRWSELGEGDNGFTDCGRPLYHWSRRWMWCRFQTLNPEKVLLCKRGCWDE